MDTDIFCVLCGGPFDLEQHIYNIDTDQRNFQHWLYDVRLLGTVPGLHNLRMTTAGEIHANESGSDDVFLSETTRWTMTDADCFRLNDAFYQVLSHDVDGDLLFPLHTACIQIACRIFESELHEQNATEQTSTLGRLYRVLQHRYHYKKSLRSYTDNDILSLRGGCTTYGPRSVLALDKLGWWSGAYEKYLTDPMSISDLTAFICSLLRSMPRSNTCTSSVALPRKKFNGLEALPKELLDSITDLLPPVCVLALHQSSRSLSLKVSLDDRFWRHHLSNGSLLPVLWDLDEEKIKEMLRHESAYLSWDWQSFLRQLSSTGVLALESDNKVHEMCKGLWNRYRISATIKRSITDPQTAPDEIQSAARSPASNQAPSNLVARLLTVGFFVILAITAAWDLRYFDKFSISGTHVFALLQQSYPR